MKEHKKIKVRRNHVEVQEDEKNVKKSFIIRGWIAGHSVRIQIDLGLDLNCISERFMKRHNLLTRRYLDPVRIKRFNGELT
jgi:hypothetical protein